MHGKSIGWDDTIVALATAQGIGAIGVIRLSGRQSINIVNRLFPAKDLTQAPSHTLHVGYLKEHGKVLDEVVISLFKGPKSYTGEDVIEISGHGSPYVLQQIIQACVNQGARLAKPGEYTQRAFLNGKLDLAQAEAVADLIASNTEASRKTALHNIRGGFSEHLSVLRDRLIKFSALIELELDFSQEDVEFADRTQLYELLTEVQQTTQQLAASFQLGNVIKNGVSVAIIGKPNAGKSTLLNALLNENRAIVSDIAGTTRDTIEEVLNIDGILFRLIDTAGIREHTHDVIESIGMEKALAKMQQADVVIYLFDVNEVSSAELQSTINEFNNKKLKYVLVGNKADASSEADLRNKFSSIPGITFISAKENRHTEVLKEKLVDLVLQGKVTTDDTIITNARHFHALQEVLQSLIDIRNGLDNNIPSDLIALDIRRCLHYLGEITGEITTEDQLDYIFSKFCIGK
ncbi:tRNA uridine-5-carboxymethylaminomethyl(34) synthesis GTPase MnmE [Niastella yeongjuensis]|uniref:tRNA modification GTPase MnmE n=1 Tax=Niastella yeongjuensis TaxID=354355 RepID=A0A1V9EY82_9BACT|nr:tRNA uridine-5-carboxymethylaminomethyl(34) synthesis GTPase MnmE [Niastella yeongjuensis]OQP51100.1 tRNA uridine-5-carboxymethylaminomethyl(34) synthesis GTPase MnmE [Niastella yeongjuensis]SEN02747.1 tRNA modification GTPase [Niastella yeongjuensis]